MWDSQRYPWNLFPINNVKYVFLFLGFNFDSSFMFYCAHFCRETTIENNQFLFLIHTWSYIGFNGTIVNRILSLHGGSVEITLKIPWRILRFKTFNSVIYNICFLNIQLSRWIPRLSRISNKNYSLWISNTKITRSGYPTQKLLALDIQHKN